MSKLTLDALKNRAENLASDELLASISGGLENACHDEPIIKRCPCGCGAPYGPL